jgi:hypothetical protein
MLFKSVKKNLCGHFKTRNAYLFENCQAPGWRTTTYTTLVNYLHLLEWGLKEGTIQVTKLLNLELRDSELV